MFRDCMCATDMHDVGMPRAARCGLGTNRGENHVPNPDSSYFIAQSRAANMRWAYVSDRAAATAPARAASEARFERLVDPDGTLAPEERAKRAANARRAHYQQMALKSVESRRRAAAARKVQP
jgi:hypothetical protein